MGIVGALDFKPDCLVLAVLGSDGVLESGAVRLVLGIFFETVAGGGGIATATGVLAAA